MRLRRSGPVGERAIAVLLGGAVLAGCGSSALSASPTGHRHAATSASAGAVDPKAVPLGDGYVSTTPKVGYVDSCQTHFGGIGGAQANGPWINTQTRTWDRTSKITVNGAVPWPMASYTVRIVHHKRVIKSNDLPINHTTGVFPIADTDPAHRYDQNPNHIAAQAITWRLPLKPRPAGTPSCTPGGPIGILSDGVLLFNALDGEGRDAAAHEVLDLCAGHPDPSSSYHHHDVPPCILSTVPNGATRLVGYARDGYGIYVGKSSDGTLPTNQALDACHGTTSEVPWNGRMTRVYHYVATLEYPYTVGCFHGTPIRSGHVGGGGGGPGGPPGQ